MSSGVTGMDRPRDPRGPDYARDYDALFKSAPGFGDRLARLPEPSRFQTRMRQRFLTLSPPDFLWRAEVVYCLARAR
jgi:hypothetical protein